MTFKPQRRDGRQATRGNDFATAQKLRDLEMRATSTRLCDLAKVEFANYADTEMVAPGEGTINLYALAERPAPMNARAISLTFGSSDESLACRCSAALYGVEMIDRPRDPLLRNAGALSDFNPQPDLPGVRLRLLTSAPDYERREIGAGPSEQVDGVFRFVRDIYIPEDAVVFLAIWTTGPAEVLASASVGGRFRTVQRGIAGSHTFPDWPLSAQLARPSAAGGIPAATVLSSRGVVAYAGWGIE